MNKYLLAFLFLIIAQPALAESTDVTERFANCWAVKADDSRLICYDNIRDHIIKLNKELKNKPKVTYQPIDLLDLKIDIKTMYGKNVLVNGYIQMVGEVAYLEYNYADTSPIVVNISQLPRDQRKFLMQGSARYYIAEVSGIIKTGSYGVEIMAKNISWK